ncbi:hypothetical protein Cni_G27195 [Canna indica]|uniref:Uncharacterized protein n=1 Tax=Canna indica TaxID=4628 RepID=A0AAQ3L122_9LILI|nr:hypothetical protein Cni_G27195 [Canna indica]
MAAISYDDFDDDQLPTAPAQAAYFTGHGDEVASCYNAIHHMSRFSLESEGDDADVEPSSEDEESKRAAKAAAADAGRRMLLDGFDKEEDSSGDGMGVASMPGTPARGLLAGRPEWLKEYASETEAGGRRRRHTRQYRRSRERWLERAWQMKKSHAAAEDGSDAGGGGAAESCRVVVRPRCGGSGRICMDMEEVRACRDLGLGLPSDWTVEIPETFSDLTAETSSGGNSPVNWRISSPGDDPKDVKARLKVWAQAVALTSASRLSG